jgi:hypothetical protein
MKLVASTGSASTRSTSCKSALGRGTCSSVCYTRQRRQNCDGMCGSQWQRGHSRRDDRERPGPILHLIMEQNPPSTGSNLFEYL